MRFLSFLASAALAALALAQTDSQIGFTSVPASVVAGTSYKLQWTGGDSSSPVTIALRKGDADAIKTIQILTTDATGNSFSWTPITSLVDGKDYSLQITQGLNGINFSGQIAVSGGIDPVSASISSILASASSAIASANATISALSPLTSMSTTSSSGSTAGTGTASPRNSTFSSATLPATTTSTAANTVTAATSSASASSTGGADAMTSGYSSPMALFCAILAAIAYAI